MDQEPLGNLDIAQVLGNFGRVVHGAPDEGNLASVFESQIDRELDAMNRGRKTRNKQPPLGARKHFIELAPHRPLAGCVSLALNVGGILQQRQHTFLAVFRKGMQVKQAVVGRRRIDFEIARVHHHAQRRMNRQRHAIHQAMRYLDGMNRERPNLDALCGPNFPQISLVEQAVLIQFVLHVSERELRAPYRDIQFRQNPGQGANVVLVPMCQHNPAHALAVFNEIRNIGNNNIDTQQFGLGKHQAGIDNDNVIAPAQGHAVHAELAQSAQGHNLQFSGWHRSTDASTGSKRTRPSFVIRRGGER